MNESNSRGTGKLILIVDDDNRNIFALGLALKTKGYSYIACQSAAEGVEMLKKKDVEIILMDMMMPEMDGYEAMKIIHSMEGYEHVPIIAVTAQAMSGDRDKCLRAGAAEYVSKPIDLDRLLQIIQNV